MPSTSVAQQKLMGMAYALKKGEMDPEEASQEVKDLADSMTLKQLKDFASTKHKGLPDHVKESEEKKSKKHVLEYAYFWWDTQGEMAAGLSAGMSRDKIDPLVQSFMDFIDGKRSKAVKEDFAAPAASVTNTPGMGNVAPATPNSIGSGDTFSANIKPKKKRKKKRIDGYDNWLKMTQ
jgi:hypothetical protein